MRQAGNADGLNFNRTGADRIVGGLENASVIARTVALGIAVDDTIHFLNRLQVEGKGASRLRPAVCQAILRPGPVIVLTTIFLVVGLAAALVADVLFLPSIILVVCGASRIKSEVWSGMMIKNRVLSPCRLVTAFTAAFVLLAVMQGPALANPFAGLAGSWKGVGTLEPLGGDAERVICRAKYNVSANTITQTITCAGTDYKINAVSKLTYSGGRLSGSWNEMIYGTGGGATGSVKGDTIFVRISGQDFDGRMSINVSGSRHTVKIMQFNAGSGEYRRVASLSLRR